MFTHIYTRETKLSCNGYLESGIHLPRSEALQQTPEDIKGRKEDRSVQEGTKDLGLEEYKHQTFLN